MTGIFFSHILQCFSGENLLDIYGIDHDAGIDEHTFHEICPALIQQLTSGVCVEESHTATQQGLSTGEG